jgi:hypothetical protein
MPAKFPKRRPDGTFCVEIVFRLETDSPDELLLRVTAWLRDWVARNPRSTWFGEEVSYSDEFAGAPFGIKCDTKELHFKMEGQASAKWWKDWLVIGLLSEIEKAFVEIKKIHSVRNCEDR